MGVCVCVCGFYNVWVCGFCNVWVCVCVGFVMCGSLGKMCNSIYCFFFVGTVFFVLYCLCIFILISFVSTSIRTTASE